MISSRKELPYHSYYLGAQSIVRQLGVAGSTSALQEKQAKVEQEHSMPI